MDFKNLLYATTCLFFTVIIGAAVYEHVAVVPQWSAAPPKSLSMFQGEYGLNAGAFWTIIHPVTLFLFLITTIVYWKSRRKKSLIISLLGYILVLIITSIYFVPELINITSTPFSNEVISDLKDRAEMWEIASIIRLCFLVVLCLILFFGLTKHDPDLRK